MLGNPFRSRIVHPTMARGFAPRAQPEGIPLIRSDMRNLDIEDFYTPRNTAALKNLLMHCVDEMSAENPIALGAMLAYRSAPTAASALLIYSTFIGRSASTEVNVKASVVKTLEAHFEAAVPARRAAMVPIAAPQGLFNDAILALMVNLHDSVGRMGEIGSMGNVTYYKRATARYSAATAQNLIRGLFGAGLPLQQGLITF